VTIELEELPPGWKWSQIGEIGDVSGGLTQNSDRRKLDIQLPYLRVANVYADKLRLDEVSIIGVKDSEVARTLLQRGDLLVVEGNGSIDQIGRVAVWSGIIDPCLHQNHLIKIRFHIKELNRFTLLWLLSPKGRKAVVEQASSTSGLYTLSLSKVSGLPVPLAPHGTQNRIVREIDYYLSRLDDAVATLERVQRNLKRYRASVLKAAVEGRLVPTEAELARKEGRDYEPADVLLARILEERKARWIEQAAEKGRARAEAKARKAGKPWSSADDQAALEKARTSATIRYQVPDPPDTSGLPILPEGWCWVLWSQIGFSQNGRAFPSKEYQNSGVRLLRPGNLHESGRVEWTQKNTRRMPERYADQHPEYLVEPGQLVMNLTAQSLRDEFLGRVCITGGNHSCLLNQRIARLTPILVNPRYLLWMFKSKVFRRFVDSLNTGSLIQHMFTSQLDSFVIPLPPQSEQVRIAAEVERLLAIAEANSNTMEMSTKRAAVLRQSILKWAFEGKLVDQDPDDEPASVLLERIKAEREAALAAAKTAKSTRRKRKKKSS
jgi:type I restriction enzyme S subunit